MAFLRPNVLIPVPFFYYGAVDNLTDIELGIFQFDAEIFYIDLRIFDANDTFDATTITLEYDEAAGADTVIDAVAVSANDVLTTVDADGLTEGTIPAGARILMTVSNPTTGADQAILITFWCAPKNTQL